MHNKISVIGAGNVGATVAQCCLMKNLGAVVLFDIAENMAKGKALDMSHASSLYDCRFSVTGTGNYDDTADSDVVIITAGVARKPGMSRNDLLQTNAKIVETVTKETVKRSPNAIFIIITNPLDVMCLVALKASGLPPKRVIGMSGVLDASRMCYYLAEAAGVSPHTVKGIVLGEHGDSMAVLTRLATIGGIPATKLLSAEKLAEIRYRTAHGGGEVVNLLGYSAYYAPGEAAAQMTEAVLGNMHENHPCSAYLTGQYGVNGLYMCVPARIGAGGIENIIELELTDNEKRQVATTAQNIRELLDEFGLDVPTV